MTQMMSRKNLASKSQWRSLDELAGTPGFEEMLHREFPEAASEWADGASRRTFLKLMAASLALAGAAGCYYKPEEKIVPYVRQPEQMIPGRALYFATTATHGGYARGILVESHEGRPTKIEGNPDHPASLGAADVFGQASLLDLYDPDRSQTVMRAGEVSDWSNFIHVIEPALAAHRANGKAAGLGLRILTRATTSPTLAAQIKQLLAAYPGAIWHQYSPVNRDNSAAGAKLAFGQDVQAVYKFDQAKVIVSLDDNFLADHPGSLRYARDFINGRRVRRGNREMNRLYVAESTPSITGAMADHRLSVKPSEIEAIARQLHDGKGNDWVTMAAKELAEHRGAGLVVAGESQPPVVHAIAHLLNAANDNIGKTVNYIDPVEAEATNHAESIKSLVNDMNAGGVKTLIILGGNPAYDAPADLKFADILAKFSDNKDNLSAHLSSHNDETSFLTQWHLPLAHELECWGDARAFDGTAGIIQPLIAPLYQGRSAIEVVALLLGQNDRSGYETIRAVWRQYWQTHHSGGSPETFDGWWEKCLNDGLIKGTASEAKTIAPASSLALPAAASTQPSSGFQLVFRPDPSLGDGSHANNGWLQELPKALTKLTWDNVAIMSLNTARKMGVIDVNDAPGNKPETSVIELNLDGRKVKAPAWILPGQPDGVITVYLGHGRTHAGRVGTGVGFNAYALRTSDAMWFSDGVMITKTDETTTLACTQNHAMMEQGERDILRVKPIGEYASIAKEGERKVSLSLYAEHDYSKGNKWGMVIDQNACIGCNACVVACQAENNIPVVGKEEVAKGREMQWLRVDAYFTGEPDKPEGPYFQPVVCMHCENAPCEVVCPVEATIHDEEGVNNMVYNRCIGTRYCSNNCPYKVRHFNFLHYTKPIEGPLELMMNPNVTVRYRGVMEKCSFCIQRINAKRIDAKKDFSNGKRDTELLMHDGEVVTACQQTCPTLAITFGNLNDKNAAVTKLAAEPTNYSLLEELQTKPRTTYLPRFTNPAMTEEKHG